MSRQTPEQLAEEALGLLDDAENFESQSNWPKAIECYQRAANYLQQSGYLTHRINDIYTRITEINNYLKQEQNYKAAQVHYDVARLNQLQDEAFTLLDGAKSQEQGGFYEDAIQNYMAAIKLLAESGWEETQLDNIKTKIMTLVQTIEQQKQYQQTGQIPAQSQAQPQIAGAPIQTQAEKKAEALRAYEEKKEKEEEMQNQAFAYMDNAKKFEKNKNFEEALTNYHKAVDLLNALGWEQQVQSIYVIMERIRIEKERIQTQQPTTIPSEQRLTLLPPIPQSDTEFKKYKLIEFEEKKKREEEFQNRAFNLIDEGKRFELERKYNEAIKNFEEAVNLLKSIGWNTYIHPIVNSISDIKARQERDKYEEITKSNREEELNRIQKTIHEKEKETVIISNQEVESKRKEFERKRLEAEQKEKVFFDLLNVADKFLQVANFDNAVNNYKKALNALKNLGSGWESYIPTIQATINNIEQTKKSLIQKESGALKKKEEREQLELKFQNDIVDQLNKEREILIQRELELREREEELKFRENRKQIALKFLESAQNYVKKEEFDKAIYAIQNAGNIFAEIQWTDELPIIESAIKEIRYKTEELNSLKQQQIQETIERKKREQEFQNQIAMQLSVEREKLSEQKKETKSHGEIRNEAFNLLEESEIFMKQAQYDKVLDFYRNAEFILNEIQFPTNSIKEMIEKVQEKINEKEILKNRELELTIQRENEIIEFQQQISENFRIESERLKKKKIQIEKREKLKELLEKRKKEAFNILEMAKNYTKSLDYDRALDSYRKAELVLNELHFPTDSIKNMIIKIINLQKEKENEKKLGLQRELERMEEEKQIKHLIEERQRQSRAEKIAHQIAVQEREKVIKAQMDAREASYSLLEEAGNYLKTKEPNYDKGISLYIQARNILEENIGWEPEINNLNKLIEDLQKEKVSYLEQKRSESEAQWKKQQEYISFQQELKKRQREQNRQFEEHRQKLVDYETNKKQSEELGNEGLQLIDEGKNAVHYREFDKAYDYFNRAITHFRSVGWDDYIHLIEKEMQDAKLLEESLGSEQIELYKIHEDLDRQVNIQVQQRKEEDQRIRSTIGEVGDLASDVLKMIEVRKKELTIVEQNKQERTKVDAKEFSRNLANMIRLKQEIHKELKKAKEEEEEKRENIQKAKDREELDDIARMIRDVKKKKDG